MRRVDYDDVAATYNRRYDSNRYEGIRDTLLEFIGDGRSAGVVEVGCGTGHWLAELETSVRTMVGIEPSSGMVHNAVQATHRSLLVQARAEALPLTEACADRLFCIHALHHFTDRAAFAREARRVLRPGGTVMIIGLDPHTMLDQWWIYDYFPGALAADRARYLSTPAIRALLERAGFSDLSTTVAQHIPAAVSFTLAVERGHVDRRSASQLMVISDAEYEAGMQRMAAEQPVLRADLRLYATFGRASGDR